jgi:hypothetical protein
MVSCPRPTCRVRYPHRATPHALRQRLQATRTHGGPSGTKPPHAGCVHDIDSALLVEVERVVEIDSSITSLSDLPLGRRAWRQRVADEWIRESR